MYTAETRLGQVERVIIHPRHRRVTALVVQGWMADTQRATAELVARSTTAAGAPAGHPDQRGAGCDGGAVLLHISDDAALRHADLDPAAYATPAADWQPPYPYTHAEVLLEPDRTHAAPGDSLGVSAKPEGVIEQELAAVPN